MLTPTCPPLAILSPWRTVRWMRMKMPSRPWGRKMKILTSSTMTRLEPGLSVRAGLTHSETPLTTHPPALPAPSLPPRSHPSPPVPGRRRLAGGPRAAGRAGGQTGGQRGAGRARRRGLGAAGRARGHAGRAADPAGHRQRAGRPRHHAGRADQGPYAGGTGAGGRGWGKWASGQAPC